MAIWLIGGTSESKQLARCLTDWGYSWVATVVSPAAEKLYVQLSGHVVVQQLTSSTVLPFLIQHSISCIIDASHPFAADISRLAIAASYRHNLPYLRYERPGIPLAPSTMVLPTVESLLCPTYLGGKRVLLTTGVKTLRLFADWHQRACLWARILPSEESRQQALAAGFPDDRLIRQRLPVSSEQERQLWRSLDISTVVTKEAGAAGGFAIKQELAQELGVQLIAIARPSMTYPLVIDDIEQAKGFCERVASRLDGNSL